MRLSPALAALGALSCLVAAAPLAPRSPPPTASSMNLQGIIRLAGSFSGDLGYIYRDINVYTGYLTVATSAAHQAQVITIPASSCGALPTPFEFFAITPGASDYPYLGLSTLSQNASVLDPNEESTSNNHAVLLGTVEGSPGALSGDEKNSFSRAPYRGAGYAGGQSSVWTMNCSDHTISASWINSEGFRVPLQSFYTSTFDGDDGEPSGSGYQGGFNMAEPTKGYYSQKPIPNIITGPDAGPNGGQEVRVTEVLTLTFVPNTPGEDGATDAERFVEQSFGDRLGSTVQNWMF